MLSPKTHGVTGMAQLCLGPGYLVTCALSPHKEGEPDQAKRPLSQAKEQELFLSERETKPALP